MDNFYLSALASEIRPKLIGQTLGRISMVGAELRLDFGLSRGRLLLASLDPASPAVYLGSRSSKAIRSESESSDQFPALLRKQLSGSPLVEFSKDPSDRVVRLVFEPYEISGSRNRCSLVLYLTGRTTNAFLTDSEFHIHASLRERAGFGIGEPLAPLPAGDQYAEYLERVNASMFQDEILEGAFGMGSVFGPQLEREFISRCQNQAPPEAFRSLLTDLFRERPRSLIYTRVPLDEVGSVPLNLKTDLFLSQIELTQASHLLRVEFDSLSQAADAYYAARDAAKAFQVEITSLKQSLSSEIKKHRAAIKAIEKDRVRFDDPDRLKRLGDVLLANLTTARIEGSTVRVVDLYDPEQREIEIELEPGVTLKQAASRYFASYQKARRGLSAVAARMETLTTRLEPLERLMNQIEADPTSASVSRVRASADKLLGKKARKTTGNTKQRSKSGAEIGRKFLSTDGYEIVVGRKDRDNDLLTFRVARSADIWMHAADYPGSHVIIRNPNRKAVPHRAIQEAAELAAFFSQAKREAKAAVHYTEKKFVSKPPKAKPGLVRLSSFKTIVVEPKCSRERIE
ncbi:MAG TPA: NFACT family protein [Blastocatellia bacterium]|nr:NFACT family protein [Blastocatellia bacterium]